MAKNLVIVESPAKGKTIAKYLGSDFIVKSCFGHIRDLPKKGLNIDVAKNFAPTYEISTDKKKIVNELKKDSKGRTVWLASDEDREGEAIAWHLCYALGLDPKKTKRIVFHEITKEAIDRAIKNPRTVDQKLVDAQQARRVLDRLVGYELSPVLWKKVQAGLSAGRVQSVAVRLIVEREREIKDHATDSYYKVAAIFDAKGHNLPAELSDKLPDDKSAKQFLESCIGEKFKVQNIEEKPATRNPGAPFTTSSLQQEAARRLGFSVRQTMTLAQHLYESGHISYMRTDSTILSDFAINKARSYITKEFGNKYYEMRQFATKNKSAQEAHEAIRPTDFNKLTAGRDSGAQRLYKLIWERALATQMTAAQLKRTEVTIKPSKVEATLLAKGEVLVFDGFMKVYGRAKDDSILPLVSVGQELPLKSMTARQTFSRPPARYSEAGLVKQLEEMGIGRPSTYAPTIGTIQARGYVEKKDLEGENRPYKQLELKHGKITEAELTEVTGADRGKLLPTYLAQITTDFLVKHFKEIIDYDFTKLAEEDLDGVAEGRHKWQDMIADFYKGFHPLIKHSENVSREETSQARHLGNDPKTKKPVMARYGRYGPMLQRGETESEEKPDFAPLPEGTTLETVTLAGALEMFKLPRIVGKTKDDEEIKANIGRFGPYVQVGKLFVSIKGYDPFKITEEEAIKLYRAKKTKEAKKHINEFKGGIKVLNGPYGPYVTDGKKNVAVPDGVEPKKIDEAAAKKLLAEAPARRGRFPRRTKKSK